MYRIQEMGVGHHLSKRFPYFLVIPLPLRITLKQIFSNLSRDDHKINCFGGRYLQKPATASIIFFYLHCIKFDKSVY